MIEKPTPQPQADPPMSSATSAQSTRAIISTVVIVAVLVGIVAGVIALTGRHAPSPGASGAQGSANAPSASSSDQGLLLGGASAPSFTLTDQTGAPVSLDSLKGRPTVFTFFDSVCPHTDCSLMAQYINFTAQDLGATAGQVNWVALSVDPWHDTQQTVDAFISNQQMKVHLTYLMGSVAQLQPLWDAFHMQSIEQPGTGIVIHSTGVFLLDSQTHEQVFLDEGFNPHTLSGDVRLLLSKGPSAFAGQQGAQATNAVTKSNAIGGMQVTLTAAPGQYGAYDFTILLQTTNGEAIPNAQVALDLSMPSMAMQPVHVDLQPLAPVTTGAYRANGVLSMQGDWVVNVTITPAGATQPVTTSFTFTAKY
ncbi:MAG TPA: SCO family protein [Ktedonobacterales bacterium]|jgi:cytochrome oxidase Cu insertion factor (SCO1/SenC/PrrC family)